MIALLLIDCRRETAIKRHRRRSSRATAAGDDEPASNPIVENTDTTVPTTELDTSAKDAFNTSAVSDVPGDEEGMQKKEAVGIGQDCEDEDVDDEGSAGSEDEKELQQEEEEEEKIPDWIRCSPADLYFKRDTEVSDWIVH